MKPIVFMSSVSIGYEHIRQGTREAIQKAGGQPIGFEDFSALNKSSRNACLDGVRDCDVYLGILGGRYGFITQSGLSPTEEEFNEAVQLGKRRLIFAEEVAEYESRQQAFLNRVGDYHTGRFWGKFKTPGDLQTKLAVALREVFKTIMKEFSEAQLKERLQKEVLEPLSYDHSQSWLITASMPTSQASLIDDQSFNQEKLAKQIFLIGQDCEPPVFDIELAKTKTLKEDHWLLEQSEKQHWRDGLQLSFVRLYLDACTVIGMSVTGRESESDHYSFQGLYIYPDTVQKVANTQLLFLSRFYNHFDPHLRWDRIALMSALHNVGHRNFSRPKPEQTSHPMSLRSNEKSVLALERPRILERLQLEKQEYVQVLKAAFERKLKNR